MGYTISTHNGSSVARQHNLRNRKVTEKESHIDKNGIHKTWLDIKPENAYKLLFDDALNKYNEEQIAKGHSERQIANYYKKIEDDPKKHAVYEMIIQVGSYKNHPDDKTCRQILNEFCKSWSKRNPNFKLIGAYYHNDELGAPHAHIDYIPCAYNLDRGMETQNALVKALNQMGYETHGIHDTAQIQWEREQNKELERICLEHGLEVEHPDIEKQKHLNINEYKQRKRIEELEKQNAELLEQNNQLIDKVNDLIDYHNDLNADIDELENGAVELARDIIERGIERELVR